jgi:hypothetical protein
MNRSRTRQNADTDCGNAADDRGHAAMTTGEPADLDSEWLRKGATLSDKTARKEFGLTQNEIVQGIRTGKLQYRLNSAHGNPFLRLLRREIEALVKKKHGADFLKERQMNAGLAQINREVKRLKRQLAALEDRRSQLVAAIGR